MAEYRIRYAQQAVDDLDAIFDFIREFPKVNAAAFTLGIHFFCVFGRFHANNHSCS